MPPATSNRLPDLQGQPAEPPLRQSISRYAPAVAWLLYVVVYGPLHTLLENHTGILAFVPVLVTARSLGAWSGMAAGLGSIPATIIAGGLVGAAPSPDTWLRTPVLAGAAAMALVGYAVGRIEELRDAAQQQVERVGSRPRRRSSSGTAGWPSSALSAPGCDAARPSMTSRW